MRCEISMPRLGPVSGQTERTRPEHIWSALPPLATGERTSPDRPLRASKRLMRCTKKSVWPPSACSRSRCSILPELPEGRAESRSLQWAARVLSAGVPNSSFVGWLKAFERALCADAWRHS